MAAIPAVDPTSAAFVRGNAPGQGTVSGRLHGIATNVVAATGLTRLIPSIPERLDSFRSMLEAHCTSDPTESEDSDEPNDCCVTVETHGQGKLQSDVSLDMRRLRQHVMLRSVLTTWSQFCKERVLIPKREHCQRLAAFSFRAWVAEYRAPTDRIEDAEDQNPEHPESGHWYVQSPFTGSSNSVLFTVPEHQAKEAEDPPLSPSKVRDMRPAALRRMYVPTLGKEQPAAPAKMDISAQPKNEMESGTEASDAGNNENTAQAQAFAREFFARNRSLRNGFLNFRSAVNFESQLRAVANQSLLAKEKSRKIFILREWRSISMQKDSGAVAEQPALTEKLFGSQMSVAESLNDPQLASRMNEEAVPETTRRVAEQPKPAHERAMGQMSFGASLNEELLQVASEVMRQDKVAVAQPVLTLPPAHGRAVEQLSFGASLNEELMKVASEMMRQDKVAVAQPQPVSTPTRAVQQVSFGASFNDGLLQLASQAKEEKLRIRVAASRMSRVVSQWAANAVFQRDFRVSTFNYVLSRQQDLWASSAIERWYSEGLRRQGLRRSAKQCSRVLRRLRLRDALWGWCKLVDNVKRIYARLMVSVRRDTWARWSGFSVRRVDLRQKAAMCFLRSARTRVRAALQQWSARAERRTHLQSTAIACALRVRKRTGTGALRRWAGVARLGRRLRAAADFDEEACRRKHVRAWHVWSEWATNAHELLDERLYRREVSMLHTVCAAWLQRAVYQHLLRTTAFVVGGARRVKVLRVFTSSWRTAAEKEAQLHSVMEVCANMRARSMQRKTVAAWRVAALEQRMYASSTELIAKGRNARVLAQAVSAWTEGVSEEVANKLETFAKLAPVPGGAPLFDRRKLLRVARGDLIRAIALEKDCVVAEIKCVLENKVQEETVLSLLEITNGNVQGAINLAHEARNLVIATDFERRSTLAKSLDLWLNRLWARTAFQRAMLVMGVLRAGRVKQWGVERWAEWKERRAVLYVAEKKIEESRAYQLVLECFGEWEGVAKRRRVMSLAEGQGVLCREARLEATSLYAWHRHASARALLRVASELTQASVKSSAMGRVLVVWRWMAAVRRRSVGLRARVRKQRKARLRRASLGAWRAVAEHRHRVEVASESTVATHARLALVQSFGLWVGVVDDAREAEILRCFPESAWPVALVCVAQCGGDVDAAVAMATDALRQHKVEALRFKLGQGIGEQSAEALLERCDDDVDKALQKSLDIMSCAAVGDMWTVRVVGWAVEAWKDAVYEHRLLRMLYQVGPYRRAYPRFVEWAEWATGRRRRREAGKVAVRVCRERRMVAGLLFWLVLTKREGLKRVCVFKAQTRRLQVSLSDWVSHTRAHRAVQVCGQRLKRVYQLTLKFRVMRAMQSDLVRSRVLWAARTCIGTSHVQRLQELPLKQWREVAFARAVLNQKGSAVQQRRALHLERLVLAEWRSEARIRRGLVMCAAAVKLLRARRRAAGVLHAWQTTVRVTLAMDVAAETTRGAVVNHRLGALLAGWLYRARVHKRMRTQQEWNLQRHKGRLVGRSFDFWSEETRQLLQERSVRAVRRAEMRERREAAAKEAALAAWRHALRRGSSPSPSSENFLEIAGPQEAMVVAMIESDPEELAEDEDEDEDEQTSYELPEIVVDESSTISIWSTELGNLSPSRAPPIPYSKMVVEDDTLAMIVDPGTSEEPDVSEVEGWAIGASEESALAEVGEVEESGSVDVGELEGTVLVDVGEVEEKGSSTSGLHAESVATDEGGAAEAIAASSDAAEEDWDASARREELCEAGSPDQTAWHASPGLPLAEGEALLALSAPQRLPAEEQRRPTPAPNPEQRQHACGHVTPERAHVTPHALGQPLTLAHSP